MNRFKIAVALALIAIPPALGTAFLVARPTDLGNAEYDGHDFVVVLVAKKNLAIGTVIKEPPRYFAEKKLPGTRAPQTFVHQFDELKYQKLRKGISEGDCITSDHLLTDADWEQYTERMVPPGHLACTVPIDPQSSGAIQAMDRVDVVFVPNTREDGAAARIIVRNVLILNSDPPRPACEINEKSSRSEFVMLALTPDQSQELKKASARGTLCLFISKGVAAEQAEK